MLFSSVFLMMSLLCSWSVHLCANSVFCLHQWHRWRHEQHCVHSGRVRYHVSYWRRYKSSQRYHRNDVPARQLYSSHRLVGTCTTVKSGYTSAMLTKYGLTTRGFFLFNISEEIGRFQNGKSFASSYIHITEFCIFYKSALYTQIIIDFCTYFSLFLINTSTGFYNSSLLVAF